MKRIATTIAVMIALSGSAFAAEFKQCEELKAEIDERIKAKGAVNYTLEIIPASEVKDQEIIGSCEGGAKKIAYIRTQRSAATTPPSYNLISKACVDAVADIRFLLSNVDEVNGLIVARPVLEGDEAYSKLSIKLTKSNDSASVAVRFDPASGTKSRAGVVDDYIKALKARVPNVVVSAE